MNRTLRLLLVFVIAPVALSRAQPKLAVSAIGSPTSCHTNYLNCYFYPESDGQIVEPIFLNGNRWSWGYSAGFSVLYEYAPGWSVSSGLWFQQLTTRQARQPAAGEGTVALRGRVIRFPILLNYYSSQKRLSPYFSFGLLTDFPITSRVVVTRTGESTQYLRLKPILTRPIFHVLLGVGVQYKLNDRYTLIAQPVWAYKFGQIGAASSHNDSYEFSLQTQVAYTF